MCDIIINVDMMVSNVILMSLPLLIPIPICFHLKIVLIVVWLAVAGLEIYMK
jgi:hypothetical protein